MSSSEFTDWIAFYKLEPWGGEAENYRAGVIAATVANVAPRAKNTDPLLPKDFFPTSIAAAPEAEQTQEEQIALLKGINREHDSDNHC